MRRVRIHHLARLGALGLAACSAPPPPASVVPLPSPVPVPAPEQGAPEPAVAEATPELPPEPDPTPAADPWMSDEEAVRVRRLQPVVHGAAADFGVDPDLVNAVIWVESRFRTKVRGPGGSRGLMQLMPRTAREIARRLGRKARYDDPEFNVDAGTYYLSRMLNRFSGDEALALAAYNRGAGTVASWVAQGAPLPEPTQRYVERVLTAKRRFAALPGAPP